jgi:polyhydroxybutyrate depolymerase
MQVLNAMGGNRFAAMLPAFLFACLLGCVASLPEGPISGPGTYKNYLGKGFNGVRRSYRVHIPPGYDAQRPSPLVVVIHGAFDTAKGIEKYSGFSSLADRENFVAMYPNGMGLFGFLQHWNAGHCCGKAADDGWDDVGFLATAIGDVSARLKIDADRIYMVGFSNGGMLTYRFAAEKGKLLAAAAPMAASIGGRPAAGAPQWRIPDPLEPVAMMIVHGLVDDDVPFEGGISQHRGGTRTYRSVEESVDFWVRSNGCDRKAVVTSLQGGSVQRKSWSGCREGSDVSLLLIKDWGHVWPGPYFTSALEKADPLKEFDTAEIIWEFFQSHRR